MTNCLPLVLFLFHHVYSSDMSFLIGEPGMKEGVNYLDGMSYANNSCTHSQYVCIIMKPGGLSAEAVMAQCAADALHLVGCNGNSDSGAAD